MKWGWVIIPAVFIVNSILQAALAWRGSQFALIMLAVTSVLLALSAGFYARGWREALDGWKRSTDGWGAAQKWGMTQDAIMRDVLRELYEYDEEAVEIHSGRAQNAGIDYLMSFDDEVPVTEAVVDELRKGIA